MTPAGSGAASEAFDQQLSLPLSFFVQSFQFDGTKGGKRIRSKALKGNSLPFSLPCVLRASCQAQKRVDELDDWLQG